MRSTKFDTVWNKLKAFHSLDDVKRLTACTDLERIVL